MLDHAVPASLRPRRTGGVGAAGTWAGLAAAGVVVGAAATVSPVAAAEVAAAVALVVWIFPRPQIILPILLVSVFVEVVSVSGVTIGRIVGPTALLVVLVMLLRGKAQLRSAAPLVWAGGYATWAIASGLWSTHLGATLTALGSLAIAIAYMLAFATLLATQVELRRILTTVTIVAVAVGIFGIATSQGRASSGTGDPNFFAAVEIVALPLALALAADVGRRSVRAALYAGVLVIVGAIFASLSRGGLLAFATVGVAIVALPSRTFFRSRRQKVVVIAVLGAAILGAYAMTGQALSARVGAVFTQAGSSGSGRLDAWRAAFTSIGERPLDGIGFGSFEPSANALMLRTPGVDLTTFNLRPNGLYAHSAYIETLAELGIPGLVLFLGLIGSTALTIRRSAVRARDLGARSSKRLADALLIAFLGWLVASIFLSSETSRPPWIVIGICLALPKLIEDELRPLATVGKGVQERASRKAR
jgi:O-antigen ligase